MLTPRLQCIFDKVKGEKAADIGTDHAYIPIELIKNGVCKSVLASDIKEGPLKIAKQNIKNHGFDITTRLGGGLSVLSPGEVDDIIIAGMGGKMILEILKENLATASLSRLILQPMNSQYELRKWLVQNGFSIIDEDLAVEGFKVYNIIVADKSQEAIIYKEDIDYHVPEFLKEHKFYEKLLDKKIREFSKIIKGCEKSKTEHEVTVYKDYLSVLEKRKEEVS